MREVVVTGWSNRVSKELEVARTTEREKEPDREKKNMSMEEESEWNDTEVDKTNESEGVGNNNKNTRNGIVTWERLFPKMVLSVLLVEADDSTRQIIAALLKKCSYRVTAVADGLKAWEMLKGRPHNIDLILTEVDLPAISGYALLTLIMEHDICKNIPVIMMSWQNSISTVYKCMMKGACDYLVKPIRKNELRNLWQHVWRRRSSLAGGIGLQDESVGQDKAEGTSENNAASNHSTGAQKSKECIEKGSDAQSSCTKPDVEAESSPVDYVQDSELPASGNFSTNAKLQSQDVHTYFGHKFPICESDTRALAAPKESIPIIVGNAVEQKSQRSDANIRSEACDSYHFHVNSSREAIDFMGASTNHNFSSSNTKSNFDFTPHLDLTLRRSRPIGFEFQAAEERHTLRHSDASAFTRYTNRSSRTPHSTSASVCDEKELGDNSDRRLSSNIGSHQSDKLGPSPSGQRSFISLANAQKESEIAKSCPQERVFPIQIPVEGVNYNTMGNNYAAAFPSVFSRQSGVSPSPSSASQPETAFRANSFHQSNFNSNSEHFYDRHVQNAHDSTDQGIQKHDHKLDFAEDHGQISPATDQSANSSFCNGAVSNLNSIGYGSTSGSNNADQVAMVKAASENKNGEVIFAPTVGSHRSMQREAALSKFRLKRKERCYEKKVRYESRKKLAEQRPRVKGQFVRQVQTDPLNSETK